MRKLRIWALFILTVVFITYSFKPASADELLKLQRQQEQLQKEISNLQKQQEQNKVIQGQIAREQAELDKRIEKAKQELEAARKQLDENGKELAQAEERLKEAEEKIVGHRDQLDQRMRVMYKRGNEEYIAVVLNSTSFSEFLARTEMVSRMFNHDMNRLEELYEHHKEIEEIKERLETKRREIVYWEQEVKKQNNSLQIATREKAAYMDRVKSDLQKLAIAEEKFLEESKKLTQVIRDMQSSRVYAGGALSWPVPGYYRITSPFGNRIHPILGTRTFHQGLDIGAPMGADTIASADGVVKISGWLGSYGNTVLIDHGSGLMTLYAHHSKLLVNVNQEVKRGQVIAKIGSTGQSTGPHLHYEVRKNGEYHDPMKYLKK